IGRELLARGVSRARDLRHRLELVWRAADAVLTVGELDVLGVRLEQCRADLLGLLLHLFGRAGHRLTPHRERARAVRVPPPRPLVGVAVDDLDSLGAYA